MPRILPFDDFILFLCSSMHLGTVGALVLFQFPDRAALYPVSEAFAAVFRRLAKGRIPQ